MPEGHLFPFNDPDNAFAINIVAAVIDTMVDTQKKRVAKQPAEGKPVNTSRQKAERVPFDNYMNALIDSMRIEAGLPWNPPSDSAHKYFIDSLWKIWGEFSDVGSNASLGSILVYYAKIRLGIIKHDTDEYEAMHGMGMLSLVPGLQGT